MSQRNLLAIKHWREWRATGGMPRDVADDPIVRRNAVIIKEAMDSLDGKPMHDLMTMIPLLVRSQGS